MLKSMEKALTIHEYQRMTCCAPTPWRHGVRAAASFLEKLIQMYTAPACKGKMSTPQRTKEADWQTKLARQH
jgi:hypothetical protein